MLRRPRSRLCSCCVAVAVGLLSVPALAQAGDATEESVGNEGGVEEQAKELYAQGAAAFDAGRYLESVKLFKEAAALVPNPALSYNLGLAYDSMGETTQALGWYRDYLRRVPNASDRAEVVRNVRRLEEALEKLGAQQVTILSTPEGATVLLDDVVVGMTPWTGETIPGQHRLRLILEGYAPAVAEFSLAEDRAMDVKLVLAREAEARPEPARSAPPPPLRVEVAPEPDRESRRAVRPVTWAVLGGGVGLLGGALGVEVARAQSEERARQEAIQIDAEHAVDEMERRQTMARVVASLGAAAAVTGGVLLTVDLTRKRDEAGARGDASSRRVAAELVCRWEGCGVRLGRRF